MQNRQIWTTHGLTELPPTGSDSPSCWPPAGLVHQMDHLPRPRDTLLQHGTATSGQARSRQPPAQVVKHGGVNPTRTGSTVTRD